jgi:hypothetical protein
MKLITKAIENKLLANPFYSTDNKMIKNILVKFFNPCGIGTWYVFEAEKHGDDWEFFGLVDLYEKELGYFTLSELESIRLPFGLSIERDKYFDRYKFNCETQNFE